MLGAQVVQQILTAWAIGHLGRIQRKRLGGLGQPGADAVAQFLGGGVCEGHHQDLGRSQRPRERGSAAMTEHQAQVQRSDREGLAGAGTGLDQAAAAQAQAQRLQQRRQGRRHSASPVARAFEASPLASFFLWGIASISGRSSASAQVANTPPAHSA